MRFGGPHSQKKNIQAPVTWNCSFLPASYTHTPKITKRKSRDSSGIVKVVGFSKNDQKSGFIETVGCDDVIIVSVPSGNFRWLARQSKGLSIARQN